MKVCRRSQAYLWLLHAGMLSGVKLGTQGPRNWSLAEKSLNYRIH
jgi:hypothetical protein